MLLATRLLLFGYSRDDELDPEYARAVLYLIIIIMYSTYLTLDVLAGCGGEHLGGRVGIVHFSTYLTA